MVDVIISECLLDWKAICLIDCQMETIWQDISESSKYCFYTVVFLGLVVVARYAIFKQTYKKKKKNTSYAYYFTQTLLDMEEAFC